MDARTIKLRAEDTKTRKGRVVPISKELASILDDIGPRRGRLITCTSGSLTNAITRARAKLGADYENLRYHDLRHTFATRMRRKGVDLLTIAKITGHESLEMHRRYQTFDENDLVRAVD